MSEMYVAVADSYRPRTDNRPKIKEPQDVYALCRRLTSRRREHLLALMLDAQTALIAAETIAIGSLNVARATPRDVLAPALRRDAAGIILVHNHPSGVAEPSQDDVMFTRSLNRACALVGVPLWDHVVLARDGHVSMRARGLCEFGS